MGTISCTKHVQISSSDVLGRPILPLSVPVSINFLCHARIDGCDGGFLSYLVVKFRWVCRSDLVSINYDTHCAFSWGVAILQRVHSTVSYSSTGYLKCNVIKTLKTTEYVEQIWRRYLTNCLCNKFLKS